MDEVEEEESNITEAAQLFAISIAVIKRHLNPLNTLTKADVGASSHLELDFPLINRRC